MTEGGSLPILEAATRRLPIVCSDIPVYREQVDLYPLQPFYFDPFDPVSIANAIERRMETDVSPALLSEIAGRVSARTWDVVANEYLRVFESVVSSSRTNG